MAMKTAQVSVIGLGFALLLASCAKGSGSGSNCPSGQMECNGVCMDVQSDSQNCGICGYACATGTTCQAAVCACAPGLVQCNGACVASNTDHCGASCTACPAGGVCDNGQCSTTCAQGSTRCSDSACSRADDSAHCGASCTMCGAGQSCSNGACIGGSTGGSGGASGGSGGGAGGSGGAVFVQPKLVTSAPNAYWNANGTWIETATGNADVTVNDTSLAQTWEGFGGAFNEAGWSYISMLSPSDQTSALQDLFGVNGAHFTRGRIPIGASDYALQRYTDDETAGDTSLNSFATTQDTRYLIPYVKAAQMVNANIRFWASPWTPPTWMKTNTGTVSGISCARVGGTAYDGGCMQDIAANLTALAQYYVKWIQAYKAQGITVTTLAPQNEPNYAQGYPSAIWAPALYTKFISQYLGPALNGMGVDIMLGTMSNGDSGTTSKDLMVVQAVMADATAKGLVKVMGLQWGMLDLYKTNASSFNTGNLPVWATEHKAGNYPWNPAGFPTYKEPAPNDQAYGVETWGYIRDAILKAHVTAYDAWNMVLDTVGKGNDTVRQWSQDSLLAVNTSSKALILTPAYYVFRHFSQFVVPGAQVVGTTGGDAVAFKNPDGSIITVLYNSGAARTMIVSVRGKKLQFGMPANGWATVNAQ